MRLNTMQQIRHRGYQITATSFQNDRERWVPRATIVPIDETANREESPFTWARDFATQEEADNFALEGAQLYIDSNY